MPITYGSMHVDEKYSATFAPNLYKNTWIIDGVTTTAKYTEKGGKIYVHKLTKGAVTPATPGSKFTHTAQADSLIEITMNNEFQQSKEIFDVTANNIEAPMADEALATATAVVREGRGQSGLACLAYEGTASNDTTALTASNVKAKILAERAEISKAGGTANILLVSPEVYALLLEKFGSEFTPVANERVINDGAVGRWYGFTVFECNGLSATSAEYYDYSGTQRTVSDLGDVDFIMYNSDALAVVDNLEGYRFKDAIDFMGVYAQVDVNTGYRVINSALVRVKKH